MQNLNNVAACVCLCFGALQHVLAKPRKEQEQARLSIPQKTLPSFREMQMINVTLCNPPTNNPGATALAEGKLSLSHTYTHTRPHAHTSTETPTKLSKVFSFYAYILYISAVPVSYKAYQLPFVS